MRSALRSTAAVIVGFVIASIVMVIIEMINGRVLYPELAKAVEGVTDRETLRSVVASAPIGALVVVIAGWILGGLAGGSVTALIAGQAKARNSLVLGALLTLAGIANNLMIPKPLWFWIASLLVLLPAAYAGAHLLPARKG